MTDEKPEPKPAKTSPAVEAVFDKIASGELSIGKEISIVREVEFPEKVHETAFGESIGHGGKGTAKSNGIFCGVTRDTKGDVFLILAKHNPLAYDAGENRNEPVAILDEFTTSCEITIH